MVKTYFANIDDEMLGRIRTDVVKLSDHDQALADKDQIINMQLDIQDNQAALIEQKDKAYKQLMEQAIEFASCLTGCPGPCSDSDYKACTVVRARAFLKERETNGSH